MRKIDPSTGAQSDLAADLGNLPFLTTPLLTCSPDGRWLAYVGDKGAIPTTAERSSRVEIASSRWDGGPEQQLTDIGANINAYSWVRTGPPSSFRQPVRACYDVYKGGGARLNGRCARPTIRATKSTRSSHTADALRGLRASERKRGPDHTVVVVTADGTPVGEARPTMWTSSTTTTAQVRLSAGDAGPGHGDLPLPPQRLDQLLARAAPG